MATRTTRTKKAVEDQPIEESEIVETVAAPIKAISKTDPFTAVIQEVSKLQLESENLQKEIAQTKESWIVEQKTHQKELEDRNITEELERKRNKETYEYETVRQHKQEEDEFADRKALWEKQLQEQKEDIENDRKELEELKKLVAGFEEEKEKSINEAQATLQKELTGSFANERKIREQEIKSEKEILNLRLTNLTTENSRQETEIQTLKKALEEATQQVKEIAVKVIESGTKSQPLEQPTTVIK